MRGYMGCGGPRTVVLQFHYIACGHILHSVVVQVDLGCHSTDPLPRFWLLYCKFWMT